MACLRGSRVCPIGVGEVLLIVSSAVACKRAEEAHHR
jgi:hypothetical protein